MKLAHKVIRSLNQSCASHRCGVHRYRDNYFVFATAAGDTYQFELVGTTAVIHDDGDRTIFDISTEAGRVRLRDELLALLGYGGLDDAEEYYRDH